MYPSQNPTSLPSRSPTFASFPSGTPTFIPTTSVAQTTSSLLGNISVLPSGSFTINPTTYGVAPVELALTVVNATYVSEYITLDGTTSILEAGRLQYMYFVVPPASAASHVTGIGISFGDDDLSSSLNVVPLTSSGVVTVSTVTGGSTLYGLSIKTPAGICSTTTGEANQCTATTVNGYSVTNTQQISSSSSTNMHIACGNVCALGSSICSYGCSQCDAGSTVAGTDTPVSRRFDMGTTIASYTFTYQTYTLKDRITVWNDGNLVFDSGCVGTGVEVSKIISYNSNSQIIRVDVEPDCECLGCTGTAWYFATSCPTCMAVVTSDGVEVQSGSDLFITSDAVMPSIVAITKGCLSSDSIQWSVKFHYKCSSKNSVSYDAGPFIGTSTIDLPLDVTALLSGAVYGGTMTLTYSGAASGSYQFTIKGTNPNQQIIKSYISSKTSLWYAIPMAIQESSLMQFLTDGTPKCSYDNGFGLYQITSYPIASYQQIYSWKANVDDALRRMNNNVVSASNKMTAYRQLANVYNGGKALPVPTRVEGLCTFVDGGSKSFEDAVAIKSYNGNTLGTYCAWKSTEWGFNPLNNLKSNYVNLVCSRL